MIVVMTLCGEYGQVIDIVKHYIQRFSPRDQAKILGENATRFYHLSLVSCQHDYHSSISHSTSVIPNKHSTNNPHPPSSTPHLSLPRSHVPSSSPPPSLYTSPLSLSPTAAAASSASPRRCSPPAVAAASPSSNSPRHGPHAAAPPPSPPWGCNASATSHIPISPTSSPIFTSSCSIRFSRAARRSCRIAGVT